MSPRRRRSRDAFTLIELIVVIALLGVAIFVFMNWNKRDPTSRLKKIMQNAEIEIETAFGIEERFELVKLSYDVRKTDSTISPFVAEAELEVVDSREASPPPKPVAASKAGADFAKRMNDLGATVTDTGRRTYVLKYAFQEGQWILKIVKARKIMLDGREEPTLMPAVLEMLFKP